MPKDIKIVMSKRVPIVRPADHPHLAVRCLWCGKQRQNGDRWLKHCCKKCNARWRARQNRSYCYKTDPKDKNRKCLICGKLGGWYCKKHKETRDQLLASHRYEALVPSGRGTAL